MKILTLIAVYLPGYKAGGPLRTIASLVDQLGDTFDFWILTGDRDLYDGNPYPGVPLDEWVSNGKASVFYTDLNALSLRRLSELVSEVNPDVVYLNSFFSRLNNKYLVARRLRMIPQTFTIIAPRGVFSPGALRIKPAKKRLFLQALQYGGILEGLRWQASSAREKKDIIAALPAIEESDIYVAPNPVERDFGGTDLAGKGRDRSKEPGSARLIFLSRISSKKNLKFALTLLGSLNGHVDFDIYGPVEEEAYWNECLQIVNGLPGNVTVHDHGAIHPEQVSEAFSQAHFFLFPTFGENFGHVIFEALRVGCPVLISDQTPWDDIVDAEAGWIMPLDEEAHWVEVLQRCVDMGQNHFTRYSEMASRYAGRWLATSGVLQANRDMFSAVAEEIKR